MLLLENVHTGSGVCVPGTVGITGKNTVDAGHVFVAECGRRLDHS